MEDNPYVKFLGAMRDEARGQMPEVYRFGTVESVAPLTISTSGILLSKDDLLINAGITERTETISMSETSGDLAGTINGNSSTFYISGGNMSTTASIELSLTKGDNVLLIPIDDNQKFIILCKVVSV